MDIRKLQLIPRAVEAVQFTGDNYIEIRDWVQSELAFQNVVVNEERVYLPSVGGMDILEPGDWVFFDREDKAFRGATDEAVTGYYVEVSE